jgi:hypothetical protein
MRGTVPQTNAEIVLWNWGNARALAGLPVVPDEDAPSTSDLDAVGPEVLEAFERLGEEGFGHWVQAGWLAGLQGIS